MNLKEIPTIQFPSIKDYKIDELDEPLVNCKEMGFLCYSVYYNQGIAGSLKDIWVRETVAKKLLNVEKNLPNGYKLKLWDGYRPLCVQRRLWNMYRSDILLKYKREGKDLPNDELIDKETSFFVSKPSNDLLHPSLHNTGGAIDLTIVDKNGIELFMGTKFDDFGEKAWANHFETYEKNDIIRDNRRLLYNSMINEGFTNLPSEWWHYDYGDSKWALLKNTKPIYNGII